MPLGVGVTSKVVRETETLGDSSSLPRTGRVVRWDSAEGPLAIEWARDTLSGRGPGCDALVAVGPGRPGLLVYSGGSDILLSGLF